MEHGQVVRQLLSKLAVSKETCVVLLPTQKAPMLCGLESFIRQETFRFFFFFCTWQLGILWPTENGVRGPSLLHMP